MIRPLPGIGETTTAPAHATSGVPDGRLSVGISACLLGREVRYNGGHKRDRFLSETLSRYIRWVPVCPEVELGLGVPREAIHLERSGEQVRLTTTKSNRDLTKPMSEFAERRVVLLESEALRGFVLKKDSPSCGLERVKVHQPKGPPNREGRGLFAEALVRRFPNLPVEEEGRLCDPRLRENWVERVFAYDALQTLWCSDWTIGSLVDFHTRHKYLLLSHSEPEFRDLGRLVASGKSRDRLELRMQYENGFMRAMRKVASVRRHSNVLEHMLGFFKRRLDSRSRNEIVTLINDYRSGHVPLIVPLTLLRHHVRVCDVAYLKRQVYLNPFPKDLALRNYV